MEQIACVGIKEGSLINTLSKKQRVYDVGRLPFGAALKRELITLKKRVLEENFAGLILLDGGVGQGKTTLAVHVADYLNEKPIDFETQLAMGGADFQQKLGLCFKSGLHVIIYDEAGDFNRRSVLSRFNQELNRVFETYRAFKIIVILVLPSFADLDENMFKKQIPRFLLHCYGRNQSYGKYALYSVLRTYTLKGMMKITTVKPMAFRKLRPNTYGKFLDLYPARCAELTKFSTMGKFQILQETAASSAAYRPFINLKEIMRKYGIGYNMAKDTIKKSNISTSHRVKNQNYFAREEIEKVFKNVNPMRFKDDGEDDED